MSCLGPSNFVTQSSVPLCMQSNVDHFIADIISSVSLDDSLICASCDEGASANSRCLDCKEPLCDPCVLAHQRVRLTKDHRIHRLSSSSAVTIGSLSSSSQTSNSPCNTNNNYCDIHREQYRYYCETCVIPQCTECLLHDRCGHQLLFIQDATEYIKIKHVKLTKDTRTAIAVVKDAIENVQQMLECVEVQSNQIVSEVRISLRRYITAIEEREQQLINQLNQIKLFKKRNLLSQIDRLRLNLSKLMCTSELLSETYDSSSNFDIILANEKANEELKHLHTIKTELIPCEENNIVFKVPDPTLLNSLSCLGNVTFLPAVTTFIKPKPSVSTEVQFSTVLPFNDVKEYSLFKGRSHPILGNHNNLLVKDNGPKPSLVFGEEGEANGQLCRPWGVCSDSTGQIIIADRSNNRIQVFSPTGKFLYKFGTQGTAPGQFDRPAGVVVNHLGNIIVADKDNHRIQIFKIDGTFILCFGEKGCRNGQFNYPWDVASNSTGHIVVSDTRNHRIQLFNSEGQFLNKYGFEGSSAMWKHFDSPRGVCFTPSGNVIVTDFNNHRLVIVDRQFMQAQFLGEEGTNDKQFLRPQGIACDDEGNIIVADSKNNRIQVFKSNGTFLWKIGHAGKGPGEFDRPSGICLNSDGRIVVVDFGNNRIQVF